MFVSVPARRSTLASDRRRYTNMYETRNETVARPGSRAAVPGLIFLIRSDAAWLCQPVLMSAPRFGVTDRPGGIVDRCIVMLDALP
jgi:hypothetical protein